MPDLQRHPPVPTAPATAQSATAPKNSGVAETFKPIAVRAPSAGRVRFFLRCLVDLQVGTIARALRPALANLPPGAVLDVGAGESPWREWLPKHCRYVGLDVEHFTAFGMTEVQGIRHYDGRHIPFEDRTFSGAICIEVLEHAEDPDGLLSEIKRVLKPGAPLLLSVPWSARRHHVPYDFHRFTREQLDRMLRRNGFDVVRIDERGDELGVIANKMVVLTITMLCRLTWYNALFVLILTPLYLVGALLMLATAHLPRSLRLGSDTDPLGYFCVAECQKALPENRGR